jgi:mono/diheme cytochrome c family protein
MTMRLLLLTIVAIAFTSCDGMPGKPESTEKWKPPEKVAAFEDLYRMNCLGCHGDGQSIAGSITLKNPVYLAAIQREVLRDIIANGVPGHNMPSFSTKNGGPLDEAQIETLVEGITSWRDSSALPSAPMPLRLEISPPVRPPSAHPAPPAMGRMAMAARKPARW